MNEDWDDMTVAEPLAGEELERMLARYARVRLDPGQARARRARAAVMEQAWRQRIGAAQIARPARRGLFSGWSLRRMGLSLTAAVFAGLLVGSTAFAASRAGGPLYEPRLALESLTLPSDPAQRVDAQLTAAQSRLAEAVEASGRHDDDATIAALDAYDRVIDQLMTAEGPAADRALQAVQFHHAVLEQIAASVPTAAANGIERALANSERVIERLTSKGAGSPGGAGGPATPPGRPTDDPAATGDPTVKPGRTKDPDPTPKPGKTEPPAATPDPRATEEPTATQKPGRTPPPHKTPDPEKGGNGAPGART
jgi:hypothetical protein